MARQLLDEGEKVKSLILIAASAQNLRFRAWRRCLSPLRFISERMELIVSTRFQTFWTNMMRLPLSQRPRFVISKLPKLMDVLRSFTLKRAFTERSSTPDPKHDQNSDNPIPGLLRDRYLQIDREYMPGSYSGKVTLLWAEGEDESPKEAIHWWTQLAEQVQLHKLPGSPHTVSLTKHVEQVAAIIRSCLS